MEVAMPLLGMIHLLIAIFFVYHAYHNGKPPFWMFILIFVPVVGSIAYVLFEILPELANNRRARQVASNLRTVVDPDREWRKRASDAAEVDSVETKVKLAEECERKGMWSEAVKLYRQAAQCNYADDPHILGRLARAQLGSGEADAALATLDDIRSADPGYKNQDAHLTYARALEAQGRLEEAEEEYRDLARYYVGMEARARYALLLQRQGETDGARQLYEQVVKASNARGIVLSREDWEWVRVAKKALV